LAVETYFPFDSSGIIRFDDKPMRLLSSIEEMSNFHARKNMTGIRIRQKITAEFRLNPKIDLQ
jgi:hypothetical protein